MKNILFKLVAMYCDIMESLVIGQDLHAHILCNTMSLEFMKKAFYSVASSLVVGDAKINEGRMRSRWWCIKEG